MWRDRRFRLLALLAMALVAFLGARNDLGVSAFDTYRLPEVGPEAVAPEDTGLREDNAYYRDCLRRRDAGDMKCGEVCYWRECTACANVCELDCKDGCSCHCSCDDCPDPVSPDPPKLEGDVIPGDIDVFPGGNGAVAAADGAPPGGAPLPPMQATPVPELDCDDYPSCFAKYGVELEVVEPRCVTKAGDPMAASNRTECAVVKPQGYWIIDANIAGTRCRGHDIYDRGASGWVQCSYSGGYWNYDDVDRCVGLGGRPLTASGWEQCHGAGGYWVDDVGAGCVDRNRRPLAASGRAQCHRAGGYWVAGRLHANFGLGVDVKPDGKYVQPFAFSWNLDLVNNYRERGNPGLPAHLVDGYKFDCEVRWTTIDGAAIPGVVAGGWPDDQCVLGHNTLQSRGFYAEATWCDTGRQNCSLSANPPEGYRLWPVGDYKVELLVDNVVVVQHLFSVAEFPRPAAWPLPAPPDRPRHHTGGPVYYSYPGQWPSGLPYGRAHYVAERDCVAEGLCSVRHPWERRLPYGSRNGGYELRPLWGDYSPELGAAATAPYPENHPGFDFVYPWCPRLDWCYQGQSGNPDPCVEDAQGCVSNYCGAVCVNCDSCCGGCDCGCSYGCSDWRKCAWKASCGDCIRWEWRTLGLIGSGSGRLRPVSNPASPGGVPTPQPAPTSTPLPSGATAAQRAAYELAAGYAEYPVRYGSGFNVDQPDGDYRSGSGTPSLWERDNTGLFQMAGDAHMLVDNYLGAASRCKGKRDTGDIADYTDDDSHVWFPEHGAYGWLNPVRGGADARDRIPASTRVPELGTVPTALPASARIGDGIQEPRECEALLRDELRKKFRSAGASLTPADVNDVFADVQGKCSEAASIWNPEIVGRAVVRSGEENYCPDLSTGYYKKGRTYRLLNGERRRVFAAGSPVKEVDFVFEEPTLVIHWNPGERGSGVGDSPASGRADYSVSLPLNGLAPASTVMPTPETLPGFASARAQPSLPVDGARCWLYGAKQGWRSFDVARLPQPRRTGRETPAEWQVRIGWRLHAVASGQGPPPADPPVSGLPLALPGRTVYGDWRAVDWFHFNTRRVVAGLPSLRVYYQRSGATDDPILEPHPWLVERYGDRLRDRTAGLPDAGVGAQGLQYFPASRLDMHPTLGRRYQQRFLGYVDTRPAPVFVISWPVGAEDSRLPYDGPKTDPGPANLAFNSDWRDDRILRDYRRRTEVHFKRMSPDPDDRRPGYEPCDESPGARHNHVLGWRDGGKPVAFAAKPCWVTYRHAERVPGLYQIASPPSGTGLSVEKFPLMRVRDVGAMRLGPDDLPVPDGAEDDHTVTAAQDVRGCDTGSSCLEPLLCLYQDHRGMLKTNFTLQRYPQVIGESYRDGSRIIAVEDADGVRYRSLLVVAGDSAQSPEQDHYQPLRLADWRIENGNVLVYPRQEGFTTVDARLQWTGYRTLPNGHIEYTDRLGYRTEINPDLLGGCRPACPYFDERRVAGQRALSKRIYGEDDHPLYFEFHPYGAAPGFALSKVEAGGRSECRYFGDGMVECGHMARYYASLYPADLPYGKLGFAYDLPFPYCPALTGHGAVDMATMEDYVFPDWGYVGPESTLVWDDAPGTDNDRDLLADFYRATQGDYWVNNRNWLSGRPLSEWHGVTTSGSRVVGLELPHNGLRGSLPASFGELVRLRTLDLSYNELSGALPDDFGDLTVLADLNLSNNYLRQGSSDLQDIFQKLARLRYLDLSHNRLFGLFPRGSYFSPGILSIDLSHNGFEDLLGVSSQPWGSGYLALTRLYRLELKGNVLDPKCVSGALAQAVLFHDLDYLGPGICP